MYRYTQHQGDNLAQRDTHSTHIIVSLKKMHDYSTFALHNIHESPAAQFIRSTRRLVVTKLAKATRFPGNIPVVNHFYPSTRFFNISTRFGNSQFFFLPVNIGEIRETTIDFMKVNILF